MSKKQAYVGGGDQTVQRAEGWKGLKAVRCSQTGPAHIQVGEASSLTMPLALQLGSGLN